MSTTEPNPDITGAGTARWLRFQIVECILVGLAGWLFYVNLHGDLPYHDVIRFAIQVEGDRYVWDIGHVLLQPTTLLWHRHLGFGQHPMYSQADLHAVTTALALAIFHAILLRLRFPPWQRIAGTILVATSCGIIILAPSGHIKMLTFPFVNAALYFAVDWEQRARTTRPGIDHALVLSGSLLGLAAAFLVSALAAAPFAAFAILGIMRRAGATWLRAFWVSGVFSTLCGAVFLFWVACGLVHFADLPVNLSNVIASIEHKADHNREIFFWSVRAARLVFGTANNLIAAQDFGPMVRAWLSGYEPSIPVTGWIVISQALPWTAAAILIATIYALACRAAWRGATCLMPLAWLLGATGWTVYYNLNDPEHWFQLTVPTVLLCLMLFSPSAKRIVVPVWLGLALVLNVALLAVPQARYPLAKYRADVRAMLKPSDLVIAFGDYGGGAHFEFLNPGIAPLIMPDRVFMQTRSVDALFQYLRREIDAGLQRGGTVYVFSILDPDNWQGAWDQIAGRGLTKARMFAFFRDYYRIESIGQVGEIPVWRLTAK